VSKTWDKAKKVIGSVAPVLGTAIGGPWGALASTVISSVLGIDASNEKAIEALAADPAKLLELKKAEIEFKARLEELGIRETELFLADRQSARDLAKVDMRAQWSLSVVVVLGFFSVLGLLLYTLFVPLPIPEAQAGYINTALSMLLGVLTREFTSVMAFWFGSSQGSKEKTAIIEGHKE